MRKLFYTLLLASASLTIQAQVSIIPKPVSLQTNAGTFNVTSATVLVVSQDSDTKSANFLNDYLQQIYGFKLAVRKTDSKNSIKLSTKPVNPSKEAYSLVVNANGVAIVGDSPAGTFYGIQTLIQLLPTSKVKNLPVPFVTVQDEPRFSYRGLHLDVGRHMFPVAFIKKYIDYIALHKLNYFHWHLTEDQGWRIEIKKYPELTNIGGYRNGTIIGHSPGTGNDNIRYGGFYTQEEVKEVVKYAMDRHINVIPEIEMPGHASAALTSYPFLGCPGTGPYQVEGRFGVFEDIFCAGKDSTFTFLQDVLDEVIPLFPSQYVHIGGDEAPKNNWKICSLCQKRIKDNNLKDEHELQSYFIQRMEKYINAKGKTIIGWDEILEGGLAPNAIVMSWRGEEGGIEAAKQNHKVIMTPSPYVYFDHSQSLREDSLTIGGYSTIQKVYSYEPVPKELSAEQGKYVMGAQANMWTEYMKVPKKVEYQLFPRLSALSEVLWSPKNSRDWADFEPRFLNQIKRYDMWGVNYSKAYYDIDAQVKANAALNGLVVSISNNDKDGKLKYRVNGGTETNYTQPIPVNQKSSITTLYYDKAGVLTDSIRMNIDVNKATAKKVTLKDPPPANSAQNAFILVDGLLNEKGTRGQESIGYQGNAEAVVDLNTVQTINNVVVHALNTAGTTYAPQSVTISGSADGVTYQPLGTGVSEAKGNKVVIKTSFNPQTVRYVKVGVEAVPVVPEGKRGAGQKTWVYLDEIQVN